MDEIGDMSAGDKRSIKKTKNFIDRNDSGEEINDRIHYHHTNHSVFIPYITTGRQHLRDLQDLKGPSKSTISRNKQKGKN
ncbi:unnamed protein product [Rhizophagus irregularis]|nr:unnamed protein product [Rhizophagus irregularis]